MLRSALSPRALLVPLLVIAVVATGVVAVLTLAPPPATAAVAAAAAVPPGPSNTGVPAGTALRQVNGTLILNQAGATYSGLDIHGRVRVDAPHITLKNSIVRGDSAKVLGALVDCNNPKTSHNGFVLQDSTLLPTYPSAWFQAGIIGHDFTVIRANISKTTDAVHVDGGNATVTRSYLHDTFYVSAAASPFHRATHNDGVQVIAGSNTTITGNTIDDNSNSALQVTQDAGAVSAVHFTGNWSSGGSCTVNITPSPRTTIGQMWVLDNLFKHDTSVRNCAILQNDGVPLAHDGNVWQDTGGAVALSRGQ